MERPDFFELKNGSKVKLPFTDTEYKNRLEKIRTGMSNNNIDMAVLTSMHNIAYYTGFIYCSFGRPYGCVITQKKIVTISANISENYTLSEAIKYLENIMTEVSPQSQITWKGKSEEIKETSNELFIIFALALLTAYLVMAATFNSFVHPFIIILTVPLAIFGGLVFILFLNSSINIFSQIALVILIGISTKNSILIVDYANQIRTTGKNVENAVKEACELRFRPIIMTSLSTCLAMAPLVSGNWGPGAGEGSRLAVGATILGGMIISTFFTLYVTPTMLLALAKNTKRIDAVDIELKKQLR